MKTQLAPFIKDTEIGQEADQILRACVHCGFCTATCPTYQLLGDELDGPRGRIYLIKEVLEGQTASRETQQHLDRCLSCRACETTCPSGVVYSRLLEIGTQVVNQQVKRPLWQNLQRWGMLKTIPYPKRFKPLLQLASLAKPLLPRQLKNQIPMVVTKKLAWPIQQHQRQVLILEGCVQSISAPDINAKTAKVLDKLQITSSPIHGCCGALSHHMDAHAQTIATIKHNIDQWWPQISAGAEAIILTASGCVSTVQAYGKLLKDDLEYVDKAQKVSDMVKDISQFLKHESLELLKLNHVSQQPIAFHSPCSLQHALQENGSVESLLTDLGFKLAPIPDAHLCCGSAGSYSILQPKLSQQLLSNKVQALSQQQPSVIATANIGCLMHIQTGTDIPVKHWIELLIE